ncbi:flippase-like domain-containing protein [bacterium]|nr:flippase-like domain-containing protein [bacterium]
MFKKRFFYFLLSIAVSILLLWFLLSQIEIQDLKQTFSQIYMPALYAFMAVSFISSLLRAWRYQILLPPRSIHFGNIFLVTLIRNLFVDLLPARTGSLSYIYILNKRLNFPFEEATSTFILSVVFDFLTLSPFLVLSVFAVGFGSTALSGVPILGLSLLFFLLIFIIFWKIRSFSSFFLRFTHKLLKILRWEEKNWAQVVLQKIQGVINDFHHIQKRRIHWKVFSVSLFIRLAKYGSLYLLLFSLLRNQGFSLEELSFWATILGITGAELSSALPIKGIGGFGTWESAWALTLLLLGFESQTAIISSGIHLISNLFEYSLGIISILILAFPFIFFRKKSSPQKNS